MGTVDPLLPDGLESELEDLSALPNVSGSEGYEDVANVVLRTKRRIREKKAQMQAEVQKAYDDDEQRRKAKEAAHQARLARLDKYKQVQQKVARSGGPRRRRSIESDQEDGSNLSEPVLPSAPPPRPGAAVKESPLKLRLKRKQEARRKDLETWMEKHAEERARRDAESKRKGEEAAALAKHRLAERRRKEEERREALEAEESEREQELQEREAEAREEGLRRARERLRSNAAQRNEKESLRAERRAAEMQAKRERLAAEAALLPQVRASAGRRAGRRALQEKASKDREKMEEMAQQKARREKMNQYRNPKAIEEVILREEIAKCRGMFADEVVQCVVGEAVVSVSTTEGDSAEEFDYELDEIEDVEDSEYPEDCEGVLSSALQEEISADEAALQEDISMSKLQPAIQDQNLGSSALQEDISTLISDSAFLTCID